MGVRADQDGCVGAPRWVHEHTKIGLEGEAVGGERM